MTASSEFVADLHTHSRYAYACSKSLTLQGIAETARIKGIDLLATGDFTHPAWLTELEQGLEEVGYGTYRHGGVNFVLGTEVSCVFNQGGRTRRVHVLVYLSSFESVRRFNAALSGQGAKLEGDGRPTLKMSAAELTALTLDMDADAVVIPAHIWTPWYGILGSVSGFDSLEECFGDSASHINAVETGLSSDPAMNWSIPELDGRAIVSFSDAHSLPNLGRELTAFKGRATYSGMREALLRNAIAYTVEFYPEEGKYHYNGHRNCGVRQSPEDTAAQADGRCAVCRRPLTLGVLHRVRSLSATAGDEGGAEAAPGPDGFINSPDGRPPFLRLVPLEELLAETLSVGKRSKAVANVYRKLCAEFGNELEVLARAGSGDIQIVAGEQVAGAILKARTGQVVAEPGFDGQYGTVRVWADAPGNPTQTSLF